jgi:hypothetical protein
MSLSAPENDASDNIKNAFAVVIRTYENLERFFAELDTVADKTGLARITPDFLRWHSDQHVHGWLTTSFIKLFQRSNDPAHGRVEGLRNGPVFGVEARFFLDTAPLFYLARYEYDAQLSAWSHLPQPGNHHKFQLPLYMDRLFRFTSKDAVRVSTPLGAKVEKRFWGLKRVVFANTPLLAVSSSATIRTIICEPLLQLPEKAGAE